jgi:hypothetical protein
MIGRAPVTTNRVKANSVSPAVKFKLCDTSVFFFNSLMQCFSLREHKLQLYENKALAKICAPQSNEHGNAHMCVCV